MAPEEEGVEIDPNTFIEYAGGVIQENPIFRAVRTQMLLDGGTEIFDAVFEYTGDYDAPYAAQGTHTTPSSGRIFEYDSTWRSLCVRKIAPDLASWQHHELEGWWRTEDNRGMVLPAIPFFSVFPSFGGWKAVAIHMQNGPIELVLRTDLPNGISYTAHFHPEENPFRVVVEKSYFGDRLLSDTTYSYDTEEGPVVHESREDCLSRNSG